MRKDENVNLIVKILIMGVVFLIIVRGWVYTNTIQEAVKKQDDLFIMNLMTYQIRSGKEKIYIYEAEDGMGMMVANLNSFSGWNAKLVDKLYYSEGEVWKYVEAENKGDVIPVIYGFFNKNSGESYAVIVENEADNLNEQAQSFVGYDNKQYWYLHLNNSSLDSSAFGIYDFDTGESFYEAEQVLLNSDIEEDDKSLNELGCNVKEFDYNDSFIEGMESFPTYGDLMKNFGEPIEVKDMTNVFIYGNFYVLVYDNIEFVIQCSRSEEGEFIIRDNDRVCRVDITGDKYILDSSYFGGIGIGSTANEIIESFDKDIRKINHSGVDDTCLERVVVRCRNDVDKYNYERGIYFSGVMDTGLALGIVFLIDENDKVVRIIMGWPTAG
ncbi:hypothetical protein [Dethiosulfatibacter aminovorans]|nr:hypothetical protein [Dethiosulfatibacter aminovorans]